MVEWSVGARAAGKGWVGLYGRPPERGRAYFYQTSITSILACGGRALLINAPENIISPQQSADVLQLPFAPFSEIFPACAVVVHHRGIGTTAQCLRAGVPSLIVPGGVDQPFNVAQILQRQAGLSIPRKHYTPKRAQQALQTLLFTPTYREHVREIQTQILREDGAATLCFAVEQVLHNPIQLHESK